MWRDIQRQVPGCWQTICSPGLNAATGVCRSGTEACRLLKLGVATANSLFLSPPVLRIFLHHSNRSHFHSYHILRPPLWFSPIPPSWQFPIHPASLFSTCPNWLNLNSVSCVDRRVQCSGSNIHNCV